MGVAGPAERSNLETYLESLCLTTLDRGREALRPITTTLEAWARRATGIDARGLLGIPRPTITSEQPRLVARQLRWEQLRWRSAAVLMTQIFGGAF